MSENNRKISITIKIKISLKKASLWWYLLLKFSKSRFTNRKHKRMPSKYSVDSRTIYLSKKFTELELFQSVVREYSESIFRNSLARTLFQKSLKSKNNTLSRVFKKFKGRITPFNMLYQNAELRPAAMCEHNVEYITVYCCMLYCVTHSGLSF